MQKKIVRFLAFLLFAALFAAPARADTDYRCLNLCVNNGGHSASSCEAQCTYNVKPLQRRKTVQESLAPHNVLNTPQPVGNTIVAPVKTSALKAKKPDEDYSCIHQCMKNGMQYQMCETSCVKPACIAGNCSRSKSGKASALSPPG